MTKEELESATNEELINELDYCGYDTYYEKYRIDIIAEIKKRMKEPCKNVASSEGMTEEEKKKNIGAIGFLEELKKTQTGKYAQEWLNASIKALEQEPYKDVYIQQLVAERNIAVEQLKKLGYELGEKIEPCEDIVSRKALINAFPISDAYTLDDIIAIIKFQTPVKPTQKWIPCSERLPKKGQQVLVTQKVRDSAIVYGTVFPFEKTREKYITAWMPKPEPYKAEMESEE